MQPMPGQQRWLSPHFVLSLTHTPALQAGRLHSALVPPSSGSANVCTTAGQSLS
jgi:hypothetical protein